MTGPSPPADQPPPQDTWYQCPQCHGSRFPDDERLDLRQTTYSPGVRRLTIPVKQIGARLHLGTRGGPSACLLAIMRETNSAALARGKRANLENMQDRGSTPF